MAAPSTRLVSLCLSGGNKEPLRTLNKCKKQALLDLEKEHGYGDLMSSAEVSVLGQPAMEEPWE